MQGYPQDIDNYRGIVSYDNLPVMNQFVSKSGQMI